MVSQKHENMVANEKKCGKQGIKIQKSGKKAENIKKKIIYKNEEK